MSGAKGRVCRVTSPLLVSSSSLRPSARASSELFSAISRMPCTTLSGSNFIFAREMLPRMICSKLLKSWAMPPAKIPRDSKCLACRISVSSLRRSVTSSAVFMNFVVLPPCGEKGDMPQYSRYEVPSLRRLCSVPCHSFPARIVVHSSLYVLSGVWPERIRVLEPIASAVV